MTPERLRHIHDLVRPRRTSPPGPHIWVEDVSRSWPRLLLEDVSDIPFVLGVPGVEEYQHRARIRASDGDMFVASTDPAPGYEVYCQEKLGLGSPSFVRCAPVDGDVVRVTRAMGAGEAFEALVTFAQNGPGLVIEPYMSIASVWELARDVQARAGVPVQVVGPEPEALWLANDKLSLDRLMRDLGLEDALVETRAACTPAAITEALRALSARHERVGLKRTRCASAMGNQVFLGADVNTQDEASTRALVDAFLRDKAWTPGEEVLIVEWADTPCSPSTQMWIPPLATGRAPRLDGIYEQLLAGAERVFVGSRPSTLSPAVHQVLRDVSETVSAAFQALGYTGRCSFDFIVVEPESPAPRVLCTECNGRWGGTSSPMHLVSRVVQGPRPAYIAKDVVSPALRGASLPDLLDALGEEAFDATSQQGRFLLYNPGPLRDSGKIDVVAMGATPALASEAMEELLPRLWGM